MMFGYVTTPKPPLGALEGLGTSLKEATNNATAGLASTQHHYGETNRYSKQLIEPSDGPQMEKLSSMKRPQYHRHEYSKLYNNEPTGGEKPVRLLELLPPEPTRSDLIHCKLHVSSLRKEPAFEAISYTWGRVNTQDFPVIIVASTETRDNTLDPPKLKAVEISGNLYAALRRLRYPTQSRFLWADQICINQVDKEEKGRQVQLMGEIYKKSTGTIIWLGEEDEDKDVLEEMFTWLSEKSDNSNIDDERLLRRLLDLQEPTHTAPHMMRREQWRRQAVTRLLNRAWFSRAWVFQEAVASDKAQVMYGSLQVSLKELFRLTGAVFGVENAAGGYARSIAKRTIGFDTLYLVQHQRRECDDTACPRKQVPKSFLGLLMQALQQLRATEKLDLIYAFAGFESSEANPRIKVDYTLPVRTAWINAARTIIQNSRSLDIFAAARGDKECDYDLPSWVPDFSTCYPYARPITAPDFISAFKASGELPYVWEGAADTETLIVKGKAIGTIMWFSPVNFNIHFFLDKPLGTKEVLDYEQHAKDMERFIGIKGDATPQKRKELLGGYGTLIRTLLADGAFGHKQPLEYPTDEIIRILNSEDKIQADKDSALLVDVGGDYKMLEKVRQWGLIVQQKRLFLSDKYEMGLVPRTAKKGDLICLLHGSKVPCVLRRSGIGDKYRLVSQCYVDGKMNCNGAPERTAWLEQGAEEFVLV